MFNKSLAIVWALLACSAVSPAVSQDGLEGAISYTHNYPDPSLNGPPIAFAAHLSADEQPAVVISPGVGTVDFTIERETMTLSWKLKFSGLTSPTTGANIHGPGRPGVNAGALYDLAPEGLSKKTSGEAEGSVILTDGDLINLLMGRMYVNITSEEYEDGELRATIRRLRSVPVAAVSEENSLSR